MATADVKEMQDSAEGIAATLRALGSPGLRWVYEPMPHEHHGTIFHGAALRAFRTVLAPEEAVSRPPP